MAEAIEREKNRAIDALDSSIASLLARRKEFIDILLYGSELHGKSPLGSRDPDKAGYYASLRGITEGSYPSLVSDEPYGVVSFSIDIPPNPPDNLFSMLPTTSSFYCQVYNMDSTLRYENLSQLYLVKKDNKLLSVDEDPIANTSPELVKTPEERVFRASYDDPTEMWVAGTFYNAGDVVKLTGGCVLERTKAGTSGLVEPLSDESGEAEFLDGVTDGTTEEVWLTTIPTKYRIGVEDDYIEETIKTFKYTQEYNSDGEFQRESKTPVGISSILEDGEDVTFIYRGGLFRRQNVDGSFSVDYLAISYSFLDGRASFENAGYSELPIELVEHNSTQKILKATFTNSSLMPQVTADPLAKPPELLSRYFLRDKVTHSYVGELHIVCEGLVYNPRWSKYGGSAEGLFYESDDTFLARFSSFYPDDDIYKSANPDNFSTEDLPLKNPFFPFNYDKDTPPYNEGGVAGQSRQDKFNYLEKPSGTEENTNFPVTIELFSGVVDSTSTRNVPSSSFLEAGDYITSRIYVFGPGLIDCYYNDAANILDALTQFAEYIVRFSGSPLPLDLPTGIAGDVFKSSKNAIQSLTDGSLKTFMSKYIEFYPYYLAAKRTHDTINDTNLTNTYPSTNFTSMVNKAGEYLRGQNFSDLFTDYFGEVQDSFSNSDNKIIPQIYKRVVYGCHKTIGYVSKYLQLRQSYSASVEELPSLQKNATLLGAG